MSRSQHFQGSPCLYHSPLACDPWRWGHCDPSNIRNYSTNNTALSQMTWILTNTAVITSYLKSIVHFPLHSSNQIPQLDNLHKKVLTLAAQAILYTYICGCQKWQLHVWLIKVNNGQQLIINTQTFKIYFLECSLANFGNTVVYAVHLLTMYFFGRYKSLKNLTVYKHYRDIPAQVLWQLYLNSDLQLFFHWVN